ncbi:hypothetical protein OK016_03710 [Vibrio chagasii]|nr:hypothetical protein [Vibrio chagasii]
MFGFHEKQPLTQVTVLLVCTAIFATSSYGFGNGIKIPYHQLWGCNGSIGFQMIEAIQVDSFFMLEPA